MQAVDGECRNCMKPPTLAVIPHIPKKSELISPANEMQSYIYWDSL